MDYKYNSIKLNKHDNVAVALRNIRSGEFISIQGMFEKIEVLKGIPFGHKVALSTIDVGEKIIKYGECMGISTERIQKGYHVHVSNVRGLNNEERSAVLNGAK